MGALGLGRGRPDRDAGTLDFTRSFPRKGGAAILWEDATKTQAAAAALKMTGAELLKLGIADEVVPEPLGGAHRDVEGTSQSLGPNPPHSTEPTSHHVHGPTPGQPVRKIPPNGRIGRQLTVPIVLYALILISHFLRVMPQGAFVFRVELVR